MRIAVIPARGGSKRIPKKNIKSFKGKPMLSYAIEGAKSSGLFDRIIVSTDDDEIQSVATSCGAEVPFRRPSNLADDFTGTVPVIAHAINACEKLGWRIDDVCCIYPAVPFILPEDLTASLILRDETQSAFCFPVTEFPSATQRALRRDNLGRLLPFYPEHELTRTQDLEPSYYDVGQFYWGHKESWLKNLRIHSHGVGFIIPSWRAIDIDLPEDWLRAELMFEVIIKSVK